MRLASNRAVTAVLARCLLGPEFQQAVSRDPRAALREYRLSHDARSSFVRFEFDKLKSFGGLITQTQHNFLWETFPYSRALMKYYAIELSVFSSYRQLTELRKAGPSRQEKIEGFTDYLKEFLLARRDGKPYAGLLEILLDERIRWELHEKVAMRSVRTQSPPPALTGYSRELDRLIPEFPKNVRCAEYRIDPLRIGAALERRDFDPARLKPRLTRLVYRMDPATGQLSVFRATAAAWNLFQGIDGRRNVAVILRASTLNRPKSELRGYFESAYLGRLIKLRRPK